MAKKFLHPDRIPLDWEEVTPEWMTAALQSHLPGVKVGDVSIVMQDDGTNRRARFALTYAEGSGPETVFLKAHAAANREIHLKNNNLWNEAHLFALGESIPVDHPLCYKSIIDVEGLDFLLLMEDITKRGADPRDATRPMTAEQVANGLRGLARLHSHYWGMSGETNPDFRWLYTWEPTEGWQAVLQSVLPTGLERGREVLPDSIAQLTADDVVKNWVRYVSILSKDPVTLVHSDTHIGNTYVLPNDDVGFLDWQVVRRGRWSLDVGYFLVSALTKEDRRKHEAELVEVYRKTLDVPADQIPTTEGAWLEYRTTPIYGLALWLATLATDAQTHEVSRTLSDRFAAAFVELDTLSALSAISA